MNSADDDKLQEYSTFAETLRKAHATAEGDTAGLFLAAAEAIEELVAWAKETREDF